VKLRHLEHRNSFFKSPEARPIGHGRDLLGMRKDGSEFPVELGLNPLRTDEGVFVLAAVVDITERKTTELTLMAHTTQLEAANHDLIRTKAELEQKNQELDEFTYVASHDLQEPVRKLISFSKLLAEDLGDELNEQAAKDLNFIVDAAHRMRDLVQALLELSRAGRTALKAEPVSLEDCANRAIDCLELRIQETDARLVRDSLPDVIGDPTVLTQLYQNLIGNALKFIDGAQPAIHLTAERDGAQWILGVKDNGIGMKADYFDRIFQPFQRLHGRGEYPGTGIGLSICKKNVERHGGRIWVESAPGAGSHFKFTIQAIPEIETCNSTNDNRTNVLLSC
jgi:light-regulated signal transduction histidine kinase (bacteriophytochrome)